MDLEKRSGIVDSAELEELIVDWTAQRRQKAIHNKDATDILIRNDANALLMIEGLRAQNSERDPSVGYQWWLLTFDRSAYRMDVLRRRKSGRKVSACMSPDYFARYLSIAPKKRSVEAIIPLSLDAIAMNPVPVDVLDEARNALNGMSGDPVYLRQRKLRDLSNAAKGRSNGNT